MSSSAASASLPRPPLALWLGGKATSTLMVFEEEEGNMLRFAFSLTGKRELAEELVQEAFLQLHKNFRTVREPRAWLFRAIRNLALNKARKEGREIEDEEALRGARGKERPDYDLDRMEALGLVQLYLAELPESDRALVKMKYFEERTYQEIAQDSGLKVGNVGYRLHHLLKELAEKLRAAGIEGPALEER